MSHYTTLERSQPNTTSYRVYIKDAKTGAIVSPFHDIPLKTGEDTFNMIVEIPRWTNAKMEVSKTDKFNPIVQDVKKGKLRFVNNIFPHHGYIWNYGALPQTWEDPNVIDTDANGCVGDNDPLDACEIGSQVHARGSVFSVKVLGALGLIDEGEADWKIIVIDVKDPLAEKLNDISDVETHLPGLLDATRDWFKIYKIPTGKPANSFALDGKFMDRAFALKCIAHAGEAWQNLIKGGYAATPEKMKDISLHNTSIKETEKAHKTKEEAEEIVSVESDPFINEPATVDQVAIDTVHYVNRSQL